MNEQLNSLINETNIIYKKYYVILRYTSTNLEGLIEESKLISKEYNPFRLKNLHTRLMELRDLEEAALSEYERVEAEEYYSRRQTRRFDEELHLQFIEAKSEYTSILESFKRVKDEYKSELSKFPLFSLYHTILDLTLSGFSKELLNAENEDDLISHFKIKIETPDFTLFKVIQNRADLEVIQCVLRTLFYIGVVDEEQYDLEAQVVQKLLDKYYKKETDELMKKIEVLKEKNLPDDIINYTIIPYMNEESL
jgi:hypothetical protein